MGALSEWSGAIDGVVVSENLPAMFLDESEVSAVRRSNWCSRRRRTEQS